eukprot:TRINITY_DN144249_c0_g1_i1.p2 TRINITY_DN144249_c0_g1~~TRINITY_DN144249_c0_g1_i1.p2  ORF type:complete len:148 (-),score=50.60 TRINITY_DN144249_c0_g1_i1:6-449(-)
MEGERGQRPLAEMRRTFRSETMLLPAELPALRRFLDPPAERLCHDLMAEADPQHRPPGRSRGAQEVLQRRDPGVILIGAGARAGDQIGVVVVRIVGQRLAAGDEKVGIDRLGQHIAEPAFEHAGIGSDRLLLGVRRAVGFEDTDLHA